MSQAAVVHKQPALGFKDELESYFQVDCIVGVSVPLKSFKVRTAFQLHLLFNAHADLCSLSPLPPLKLLVMPCKVPGGSMSGVLAGQTDVAGPGDAPRNEDATEEAHHRQISHLNTNAHALKEVSLILEIDVVLQRWATCWMILP